MTDSSLDDSAMTPLAMLAAWHRLGGQQFATIRSLADRAPVSATELAMRDAAHAVLSLLDDAALARLRDSMDSRHRVRNTGGAPV